MRQQEAVARVSEIIQQDGLVRAIFLKGSLARGEDDEYSDVDFYCIVKDDKQEEFLTRRLEYLESYKPLIYWSEANFVGPQIVGVFDDGLHFDLYAVTLDTLSYTDGIKVIYDPENLLSSYKEESLTISEVGIAEIFNEFSFAMLEFEAAYKRKDLIWASRLGSHLSGDLAVILRYIHDKEKAKLGFKRLHQKVDDTIYKELYQAMDNLGPSYLPSGVIMLGSLAEKILEKLPIEVANNINKPFFNFMFNKIRGLN